MSPPPIDGFRLHRLTATILSKALDGLQFAWEELPQQV
jgi:hypothetical protein